MPSHWLMSLYSSQVYFETAMRVTIVVALLVCIWSMITELRYNNPIPSAALMGFTGFVMGGVVVLVLAALLPVAFSGLLWAFFL